MEDCKGLVSMCEPGTTSEEQMTTWSRKLHSKLVSITQAKICLGQEPWALRIILKALVIA